MFNLLNLTSSEQAQTSIDTGICYDAWLWDKQNIIKINC